MIQNPIGWEIELGERGFTPQGIPTQDTIETEEFTYEGLLPATSYDLFVRTICQDGTSDWNGRFSFNTNLSLPSQCQIDLPINDDNCPTENVFRIEINDFEGALLGLDKSIERVDLIINHPWPPDLKIELLNPNGVSIPLVAHKGIGSDDFGNSNDISCQEIFRLSPDACDELASSNPPFIGSYKPEGDLNKLLDGSEVNGIWELQICDRAQNDVGSLKYVDIGFSDITCPLPPKLSVTDINSHHATLHWTKPLNCDLINYRIGMLGFTNDDNHPITVANCDLLSTVMEDLTPGTTYEVYVRSQCELQATSTFSCPLVFTTACQAVTHSTSFDELMPCEPNCISDCEFDGFWKNASDDIQWLVQKEPTPIGLSGPNADVNNFGNYLYIENCQIRRRAVLESECLEILSNDQNCDLTMAYHMFGAHVDSLMINITVDDGDTWNNLFLRMGGQGEQWNIASLDLSAYQNMLARFQIVATTKIGERANIGIDQINFLGSIASSGNLGYFDADLDTYGDPNRVIRVCQKELPLGYVDNNLDCNDERGNVNPEAQEIPCNLIDENCNGNEDDSEQINPLDAQVIQLVNESCRGSNNGVIEVQGINGTPPYEYMWNDGNTNSIRLDLSEGVYSCTITDETGCLTETGFLEVDAIVDINILPPSIVRTSCRGATDGSIEILHSGNILPYQYLWSNGDTTRDIYNLGSGFYQLTITDGMGCQAISDSIEVTNDQSFIAGVQLKRDVNCFGLDNGYIELNTLGGESPFDFRWDIGITSRVLQNLSAGTYNCTVTDAQGCIEVVENITISEPDSLRIGIELVSGVSCFGENDGKIEISALGGTPPYTFKWEHGPITDDIFSLTSGTYSVTVTDSQACTAEQQDIIVSTPSSITIDIDEIQHVDCPDSQNGSISVNVEGGSGNYLYFWSPQVGNSSKLEGLSPDFYDLIVIDEFNCKRSLNQIAIEQLNEPIQVETKIEAENLCPDDTIGVLVASVSSDRLPLDFNWSAGVQNSSMDGQDSVFLLPPGSYNVTVTDNEGCTGVSELIALVTPEPFFYNITNQKDAQCFGQASGQIEIEVQGGEVPIMIDWNNDMTGESISDLNAGNYQAHILDSNGCEILTDTIRIDQPSALNTSFDITDTQMGQSNGTIFLHIEGGTPDYQILWDEQTGNSDSNFVENLGAGNYFVSITDAQSCMFDTLATVRETSSTINSQAKKSDIRFVNSIVTDALFVQFSENINKQAVDLLILDVQGRQVLSQELSNNGNETTKSISLTNLSGGIYIAVLEHESILYHFKFAVVR